MSKNEWSSLLERLNNRNVDNIIKKYLLMLYTNGRTEIGWGFQGYFKKYLDFYGIKYKSTITNQYDWELIELI